MSETADSTGQALNLDLRDDGGFPAIDEAAWRGLVDKTLKGADFDKRLVKKTADGIAVKPLYGAADASGEIGLPGQMPFTRGGAAAHELSRPWDITLRVEHPDLVKTNAIILEGLEGGVSHLDLVIADHTQGGLTIKDKADMEALMQGVDLSLISVSITGGEDAGMVSRFVAMIGGPKVVKGAIGLDPLGALATRGGLTKNLEESLAFAGSVAQQTAGMTETFRTMSVDMRGYDAAGASPALSLGIAMATGVAYLRALEAAGLSIDDAARQISFTLTTDTDLFVSIAKLRAARTLWARIATASGGAQNSAAMVLGVETASRVMAQRDPHTNILRTAIAGFSAALGGADAISILPFTHALGLPHELARRVARNIHVLLAEETNLGRVMDPAGGSFALERLTDDVAAAAWRHFQDIEALGGMAAALTSGWVHSRLAELGAAQARDVATRKITLTGVSEFPDIAEAQMALEPRSQPDISTPEFVIQVEALEARRLAEPFEVLRDRADAHARASGAAPSIFLANIGHLADFTARAGFAQNLFESGGVQALPGEGYTSAAEAVKAFKASGTSIACLCSSDDLYGEHAADFGKALKEAGAKLIFLAGNPGEARAAYEAAGISHFIHVGTNVLEALAEAQDAAGVPA